MSISLGVRAVAATTLAIISLSSTTASAYSFCGTGTRAAHEFAPNQYDAYQFEPNKEEGYNGCCLLEQDATGGWVCSTVDIGSEEECNFFTASCECKPWNAANWGFWGDNTNGGCDDGLNLACYGIEACTDY